MWQVKREGKWETVTGPFSWFQGKLFRDKDNLSEVYDLDDVRWRFDRGKHELLPVEQRRLSV